MSPAAAPQTFVAPFSCSGDMTVGGALAGRVEGVDVLIGCLEELGKCGMVTYCRWDCILLALAVGSR